jgi:hypothetical protein
MRVVFQGKRRPSPRLPIGGRAESRSSREVLVRPWNGELAVDGFTVAASRRALLKV